MTKIMTPTQLTIEQSARIGARLTAALCAGEIQLSRQNVRLAEKNPAQLVGTVLGRALDGTLLTLEQAREQLRPEFEAEFALRQPIDEAWIDALIKAEEERHARAFGQLFDLAWARSILVQYAAEIPRWRAMGYVLMILPRVLITRDSRFPGWTPDLPECFWQWLDGRQLVVPNGTPEPTVLTEAVFGGYVLLADPSQKPAFDNGRQLWPDDERCLAPVIKKWRRIQRITTTLPRGTRFEISALQWEDGGLRQAVADHLHLLAAQVRFQTAPELNGLPRLYPELPLAGNDQTNTSEWLVECYGSLAYRLDGGDADYGGLADVHWFDAGLQWRGRSFRAQGVLGTQPLTP